MNGTILLLLMMLLLWCHISAISIQNIKRMSLKMKWTSMHSQVAVASTNSYGTYSNTVKPMNSAILSRFDSFGKKIILYRFHLTYLCGTILKVNVLLKQEIHFNYLPHQFKVTWMQVKMGSHQGFYMV